MSADERETGTLADRSLTTPKGGDLPLLTCGLRVLVLGSDRAFGIGPRGIRVGSAPDNDLVLADRRVSRHHAEISSHPGGARVRDLNSRNGTFLGGVRVKDAVAPPGALLSVGNSELLIETEAVAPSLEPASSHRLGALLGRSVIMRR